MKLIYHYLLMALGLVLTDLSFVTEQQLFYYFGLALTVFTLPFLLGKLWQFKKAYLNSEEVKDTFTWHAITWLVVAFCLSKPIFLLFYQVSPETLWIPVTIVIFSLYRLQRLCKKLEGYEV